MPKTGWLPDLPDIRDYDASDLLQEIDTSRKMSASKPTVGGPPGATDEPTSFDGRKYCSPIESQGRLGSCTAQAVVGMVEYMEKRIYGRHIDASRLFVYKMARQLDGFVGDTGSHIRTAMKALHLFGAPPEKFWPYKIDQFDEDPPAFAFAYGQSLQAISYYRIDIGGRARIQCLDMIKRFVTYYRPVVLGFRVYTSNAQGEFPMPEEGQRARGGHAVMVCGYDDNRMITGSKGALLIRNSWGRRWGTNGYGWLPYDYILKYLSSDFWTLLRKESFMR